MGLVSKIKLLFKVKKPIGNLIKEANNMKSGWKTSEFWLTVVSNLITIAGVLNGIIDPKTAAIVLGVLNGIYSILRTLAKAGDGKVVIESPAADNSVTINNAPK